MSKSPIQQLEEAASAFGRLGGSVKSKKKAESSARNAKKATAARKRKAAARRKLKEMAAERGGVTE
jgi:hypothetical protein